jgi:hypothetical protein
MNLMDFQAEKFREGVKATRYKNDDLASEVFYLKKAYTFIRGSVGALIFDTQSVSEFYPDSFILSFNTLDEIELFTEQLFELRAKMLKKENNNEISEDCV